MAAAGERPAQGLFVVDTRSGELVHRLAIEGTGREIPTVVALPGLRRPALMSPNNGQLPMTVAYDRSWDPASARPSGLTVPARGRMVGVEVLECEHAVGAVPKCEHAVERVTGIEPA